MASKRIDELDARTVADTDLLPVTPSGGPSGKATVAAIVAEGLSQPNSASAGAGASITIKAADGVTSGAGGSITLQPGAQATTGGDGSIIFRFGSDLVNQAFLFKLDSNNTMRIRRGNDSGYSNLILQNIWIYGTGTDSSIQSNNLNTLLEFRNTWGIGWSSGSPSSAGCDTSLRRGAKQIISVNSGAADSAGSSFAFKGNTPAAITANQNDYVLTGSAFQRLNCTTASDITGIAPPTSSAHVDGRMIRLVSVGTNTVRLMHNSTSSTAANRMYMHSGTHVSLTVNEWADLVYDSTDNGSGAAGWRVVKYA
jgi:hypothetical protein